MKILVTGAKGQLGSDIVEKLIAENLDNIGTDKKEFDIVNYEEAFGYINSYRPNIVIHCAAYTDVDSAEINEDVCYNINVNGTKNIADICYSINATMVFISTDYIFDGKKEGPYNVNDEVKAISVYGRTKVLGEKYIIEKLSKYFIVRTSWLFGGKGNNFINKVIEKSKEKKSIDVICDQVGSPTYGRDLAGKICELINTNKFGVYHITNSNYCSRAELAEEVFNVLNCDVKVNFVRTKNYNSVAKRPQNSILSNDKLASEGFDLLPEWKDALRRYLLKS